MASNLSIAAESFERTLGELGVDDTGETAADPVALGRRGALLAAADLLWRRQLGPSYSTRQVRELMRIGSRQAISDRVKRHRLLALPGPDGQPLFPAFQFTADGRPLPALHLVLERLAGAVETPYTTASWLVTPEPLLEDRTPAEWLREGEASERVLEAAARYVERLKH